MLNFIVVSVSDFDSCLISFVQLNAHREVGVASKKLQSELKKRFKKYTDPSADQHEWIFILGTALDPRY